MFYLDTRETELISLLEKASPTIKQLPIADIWIGMKEAEMLEGGLVVERKSIRDFEASILDGRYREQRGRILAFCQEHKTQPVYVLEGYLSSQTRSLPKSTLMKYMNRLIMHYQIPVIQTASVQETSELIQTLVEQWKEDPTALQRTTELVKVADGLHVHKKANAADPRQFALACLAQCPGVSVKMAEAILDHYVTLRAVMNADAKEIEQIKVGTRKVGTVVSKRLHEILNA
jgi:ERCC4-type nuclease